MASVLSKINNTVKQSINYKCDVVAFKDIAGADLTRIKCMQI